MIANYHTHTVRCHHAKGTEREYIEQALARGVQILGFSDHTPQVFDDGYVSSIRMLPEQLEDYVITLRSLREEYAGRIQIKIGLEVEYYPKIFDRLMNLIRPWDLDYLILGQHFSENEPEGRACPQPTESEADLERYVKQVIQAMETGVFSCVAHPDILNYTGEMRAYRKWYEKLCVRALELHIPLEMNMLGYITGRHYPNKAFFRIMQEVGNDVILGCDAHNPERVADPSEEERCIQFLGECGINQILGRMNLISPEYS